jgi:hypothetical protein
MIPEARKRARRSWARVVVSIDASLEGGWMFVGEWLDRGAPAPVTPGELVLLFDGWDTRKGPRIEAVLCRVSGQGLESVARSEDRGWALELARAADGLVPTRRLLARSLEEEIRRARKHLATLEARLEDVLAAGDEG